MTYAIYKADVVAWLNDYGDKIEAGQASPFHACLCDPPYYLGSIVKRFGGDNAVMAQYGTDGLYQRQSMGFMSQQWDGFESPKHFQSWCTEWGEALLRCLYPNAVVFIFGGTRTFHRLVCGLEDAGFEIYDSLGVQTYQYVYGSGFPKGQDISKYIDKSKGLGSDDAKQWDGYNTLLKPAFEPILFARKPRAKMTYVETALEFGTGALNVDVSRLETNESWSANKMNDIRGGNYIGSKKKIDIERESHPKGRYPSNLLLTHHPDCTDDECHALCQVSLLGKQRPITSGSVGTRKETNYKSRTFSKMRRGNTKRKNDKGLVSRYFYSAKAQTWERDAGLQGNIKAVGGGHYAQNEWSRGNMGRTPDNNREPVYNNHPTVKPIEMLAYLAAMLKPPIEDSRILVPFSGSGSEMIACHLEGWSQIVGIELEDEYIETAQHRLAYWTQFDSYEAVKAANDALRRVETKRAANRKSGQLSMFDKE